MVKDRSSSAKHVAPRLYALIAKNVRIGVIFRRGPSKIVQLIRWDLEKDELQHGQWFKGRIREDLSDISPSGELLIYFAVTYRPPYGTWTAISKIPYFTALALWPQGDSWWGGGRFINDNKIYLHHPDDKKKLAEGFHLKKGMSLGEKSEICQETNGWYCVQEGTWQQHSTNKKYYSEFNPPRIDEKKNIYGYRLQLILVFYDQKKHYRIFDQQENLYLDFNETDWAEWDQGDLVFAKNGCLYRLSCNKKGHLPCIEKQFFQLIYNFRKNIFTPIKPPPEIYCWP